MGGGALPLALQVKSAEQLFDGEPVVRGHRFQDTTQEGAGFQRSMIWNGDVVRAADGGGEADVGTILAHALIAEHAQGADEVGGAEVARDFHTASASSRTKWRRMICGMG